MAYAHGQIIDAAAIAELPDGTWYLEYVERLPSGQDVSRRKKASGPEIESIRRDLETNLANETLPVGRVRVANPQSVHIQFGESSGVTLSIHLPIPAK